MKKLIPILLLASSTLLAGCGSSNDDFNFNGNNPGVLAAPVARNDAYTTNQNVPTSIPLAQGVLANDTLNAGPNSNVTVNFPATTAQGGTVSLGDNFGGFTYTPANGFTGTDSFTYTVSNGFASASATVSITVTAAQITQGFFVDSANGSDTTGNFQTGSPFQTIQAAVTAAGAGADIVVRPGNYAGAINLLNGQRLLGSGSVLVNAQGTVRPSLTGPVILADGNTVDFVRIAGTNGADAINGDDQIGGTVTNCEIANITSTGVNGSGISGRRTSGQWTISNNSIDKVGGIGVTIGATDSQNLTVNILNNTISNGKVDAIALTSSSDGLVRGEVKGNILTNNQPNFTYESYVSFSGTTRLDIENNKNDDFWRFSNTSPTAFLGVEQLSIFETINTGTLNVLTGPGFFPVTDISNGTAGF